MIVLYYIIRNRIQSTILNLVYLRYQPHLVLLANRKWNTIVNEQSIVCSNCIVILLTSIRFISRNKYLTIYKAIILNRLFLFSSDQLPISTVLVHIFFTIYDSSVAGNIELNRCHISHL